MLFRSLPILLTPPAYAPPPNTPAFNVTLLTSSILLSWQAPPNNSNQGLIIEATPPVKGVFHKRRSLFRTVAYRQVTAANTLNIKSDWEAATGLSWPPAHGNSCLQIVVQVRIIDLNTGIAAAGYRVVGNTCVNAIGVGVQIVASTNIIG